MAAKPAGITATPRDTLGSFSAAREATAANPMNTPVRDPKAIMGEDTHQRPEENRHHHDPDEEDQLVVGAKGGDRPFLERSRNHVDHPVAHALDK